MGQNSISILFDGATVEQTDIDATTITGGDLRGTWETDKEVYFSFAGQYDKQTGRYITPETVGKGKIRIIIDYA